METCPDAENDLFNVEPEYLDFFEKHKTFANWSPSCWKRMGRGCMATNVETFDIRFHPRNTINAQFLIELAIDA